MGIQPNDKAAPSRPPKKTVHFDESRNEVYEYHPGAACVRISAASTPVAASIPPPASQSADLGPFLFHTRTFPNNPCQAPAPFPPFILSNEPATRPRPRHVVRPPHRPRPLRVAQLRRQQLRWQAEAAAAEAEAELLLLERPGRRARMLPPLQQGVHTWAAAWGRRRGEERRSSRRVADLRRRRACEEWGRAVEDLGARLKGLTLRDE